ncbi:hypothetical protein EDD55_1161 [Varunaivibrio sulfuroxidans]|uniref:Uncharacterized protein n=2 Tax=Varunaivibrio sulfuroxidans TaxID=1773489 RepID=A0A4R3J214_9PROT|nr:hypothetical protein EDD55_1161 [Varunaivibrio sulfuroxidans]
MEAYIKFRASKYRDAKELFDIAWKKIDLDEHLSSDEKLYFKGFVLGPAQMTIFFLKHRNNLEPNYNNIHKCNIYGVDLQKISKKWKTHFPMRDHPDWDKYGV